MTVSRSSCLSWLTSNALLQPMDKGGGGLDEADLSRTVKMITRLDNTCSWWVCRYRRQAEGACPKWLSRWQIGFSFSPKLASGGSSKRRLRQLYPCPKINRELLTNSIVREVIWIQRRRYRVCCRNESSKRLLDVYRLVVIPTNPKLNGFI
jgi:hypothetical protein